MGDVHYEAAHHLIARRYLVLEVYAAVGEGNIELGNRPFFALAPDPSWFMQNRGYGLESIRESTISPLEAAFSALGGTTR
jgi:hypothetical protein